LAIDPGPCRWALPDPRAAPPGQELLSVGADLAPATLLAGYRAGMFPMPHRGTLAWLSPDPRGVLPLSDFHASRSLRRSARNLRISVDQRFEEVLDLCADPVRPGSWITRDYAAAYRSLFALGWAHTVEVWRGEALVGGLLGVEIGGLFCGESMARRATDASKAAVWATVSVLGGPDAAERLFDVQWLTPHLASLGAREIPRAEYLTRLAAALALPPAIRPMPPVPAAAVLAGFAAARAGERRR
jgi:leucyl/phenylalanyl-tRNA--protein transferase